MNYDEQELLEALKKTYQYCEHQDSDGFTFSVEASGARGGNCWGDYASSFRNSTSEMTESIQEDVISGVKKFLNMLGVDLSEEKLYGKAYSLAEEIVDSSYDTKSDSEYYGNYTEYNKYFVSISEILNFLDITDEEKEKILLISNEAKEEIVADKYKESSYNYLNEVENKISNFEKTSEQEEKRLKSDLEKAKNDLTLMLGEDYINNQKSKKRKYGY